MENRNRYQEMDNFLKRMATIANNNLNLDFNCNIVYSFLREKDKIAGDIKQNFFLKWVEDFKNCSNIDVFVDQRHPKWCQFINCSYENREVPEMIKIYIPQDFEHIFTNAKSIFSYLAKENIEHISKIGNFIGRDDLVIRIINKEDLLKILNYIGNTKNIQNTIVPPNPFLITANGVGLATDDHLSYNQELSNLIAEYISNSKMNANIHDFNLFVNKKGLMEKDDNLRMIYKALSCATTREGNINDIVAICEMVEKGNYNFKFSNNRMNVDEIKLNEKSIFLNNASKEQLKKYGKASLQQALQDNDLEYRRFTRQNNARAQLLQNIRVLEIPSIIQYQLNQKGIVLKEQDNIYKVYVDELQKSFVENEKIH